MFAPVQPQTSCLSRKGSPSFTVSSSQVPSKGSGRSAGGDFRLASLDRLRCCCWVERAGIRSITSPVPKAQSSACSAGRQHKHCGEDSWKGWNSFAKTPPLLWQAAILVMGTSYGYKRRGGLSALGCEQCSTKHRLAHAKPPPLLTSLGTCRNRFGPGCQATMAICFWITCTSGGLPDSDPLRYEISTRPCESSNSSLGQSCQVQRQQTHSANSTSEHKQGSLLLSHKLHTQTDLLF